MNDDLRRPLLLAAISGLLVFASFPPLDFDLLGWVALVPLLVALEGQPPARGGLLGAAAGGVAFLALMTWMRVFGLLAWVLVAAYLAAYVALFGAVHCWIAADRGPAVRLWGAAFLWTALEYLRSIGAFGFPWALLGLTQHAHPSVLQVARYAGVFGVSFLLVLASAALAQLIAARRPLSALLPVALVAAAIGWGTTAVPGSDSGSPLHVAAVQPNVNPRLKFDPLLASGHMQTLRSLVVQAGRRGGDVIVLPETAIPFDLFGRQGVLREVGGWANRAGATLIATSLEGGTANIAVSVAPSGQALSRYDKVRLVAFGEYGVTPGRRYEPLWTPSGRVGIAVCFESIFPDVARALVRNGAEVLAVITNDGWFDGTAGVPQHAAHSVLRAVESGRWVVRAANTGRTMVVDPAGRVRGSLPLRSAGVLSAQVDLVRTETFYSRWGDAFAHAVLVALALLTLPRLGGEIAAGLRRPAFQQATAAAVLPVVSVYLLLGTRAAWAWPGLVLAYVLLFTALRGPASWGFRVRGGVSAALLGIGAVAVLWGGLAFAFRAYEIPVAIPVPAGGWVVGVVRQLVAALAAEAWLRGIVFAPTAEWNGPASAVIVSAALGVVLQRGLGGEAMAWTLVTGVLFGLIRLRTGNAAGLVVPHALANLLFAVVATVR